jgi:membrane-associated phospholipid phosphatase
VTLVAHDLEAPGTETEVENSHLTGSVVRAIALVLLIVVIAPAIIVNGDRLAVPAVALVLLGEILVVIAAMTYWLLTVGAPALWLARRLRLTPDRLLIGVGAVVAAVGAIALLWFHSQLLRQHSPMGQFDLRAAAAAGRLVGERNLMSNLNRYGQKAMLVLPLMLVIAALVSGAWRSAALVTATMGLTGLALAFLKTVPPAPLSALGQLQSYTTQWPSGHAAVQGAAALGLVLWWWGAGLPRPSIVAAIIVPVAALTGYSRAFLGIHWLSEVFSGWVLAAVAASIVVVVDRLVVPRIGLRPPSRRWLVLLAFAGAIAVSGLALNSVHRYGFGFGDRGPRHFPGGGPNGFVPGGFAQQNFRFGGNTAPTPPTTLTSDDPSALIDSLPHFSDTLLGEHVQPVSLVVVASEARLRAALKSAGWTGAEVLTPKDLGAELTGSGGAKVAPTFYDTSAPDLMIRRASTERGKTHEAQVWQLPVITQSGCSTWAITTTLDEGTHVSWPALFPERSTGSAIDTERDDMATQLKDSGLDDLGLLDFAGAMHGTAPGGSYVTDGKIALLQQAGCTTR